MTEKTTSIRDEIKQRKPFRTSSQEAFVALLRTTDVLRRNAAAVVDPFGITLQQYNVLRILRGAGSDGLPTLEIAERMIEQTPGITRLIDRLETKGLVERERSVVDRRAVFCRISSAGLDLLSRLDPVVDGAESEALGKLRKSELSSLIELLDRVRAVTRS